MSNDESLSALLRIDFAQADLLPRFREIADVLLNRVDLLAGDTRFEICELEFYARTPAHNDVFAHTDPLQQTFLQWYFHRSGPVRRSLQHVCALKSKFSLKSAIDVESM